MITNKPLMVCDECESEFYTDSSKMKNLCPECAHYLYGYENCKHEFENGHCLKCYWNGNPGEFLKKSKKEYHIKKSIRSPKRMDFS